MNRMKAIETYYNGYRFRSRLEARWAVFFDELGIKYQYEPEGFKLSDGTLYLPDFYLPDLELWVEVKGIMAETDENKLNMFISNLDDGKALWIIGDIPSEDYFENNRYEEDDIFFNIYYKFFFDNHYWPCICPICGKPGIEFEGRGSRICHHRSAISDNTNSVEGDEVTYNDERVLNAYRVARMARFEHGETPDKYKQNFFIIKDNHGYNIIIRLEDDGFSLFHPQCANKENVFVTKEFVMMLVYSLCSDSDFDGFQKWLTMKGR